jgi:hypothetical protein
MRATLIAVVVLALAGGCSTTERVGRPPSPAEIARINDAARAGRALVVEYAAPLPPQRLADDPVTVASADTHDVTFITKDASPATLPLSSVAGVEVTADGRVRGAVIGGSIGAALELGALALFVNALQGTNDPGAPQSSGCNAKCGEFIAIIGIEGALVGSLIGALIGTPRHFRFGDVEIAPTR